MPTNTFPDIADTFTDLTDDFLTSARDLPGAESEALANRNEGFEAGLLNVETNLKKCLVSLPNGQKIFEWEYEALQQLAVDNGEEFKNLPDRMELEGGSVVEACFGYMGLSDIGALAHLTGLRELRLYGNPIVDLRPISSLKELSHLYIGNNEIEDISSLAGLLKSQWQSFFGVEIRHLSVLKKLPKLSRVAVSGKHLSSKCRKVLEELKMQGGFDLRVP